MILFFGDNTRNKIFTVQSNVKISKHVFATGQISYGLIPQIRIANQPNVYQPRIKFGLGYLVK